MREGVGRISRGSVLALWRQSPTGRTRLGITASTKVGNAVIRNRAKRWTREWFRKSKSNLPIGVDLIIIVRRGAVSSGHPAFDRDLGAVERTLCRAALAPAASGGPSA